MRGHNSTSENRTHDAEEIKLVDTRTFSAKSARSRLMRTATKEAPKVCAFYRQ